MNLPPDAVIEAVRARIFHRSRESDANAPLREIWSERRGWYHPTKEELFRQQCVVTDELRRSGTLLEMELSSARAVVRRRDAAIRELERSLVELSIEWHAASAENARAKRTAPVALARGLAHLNARVSHARKSVAWRRWRQIVVTSVRDAIEETLEKAQTSIERSRDESATATRDRDALAAHLATRRGWYVDALEKQRAARTFRAWVTNAVVSRANAIVAAAEGKSSAFADVANEATRARSDRDVVIATLTTELDELRAVVHASRQKIMKSALARMRNIAIAPAFSAWKHACVVARENARTIEADALREQVASARADVETQRETLTRTRAKAVEVVVKKMSRAEDAKFFSRWRSNAKLGLALKVDRACKKLAHIAMNKRFKRWRSLARATAETKMAEAQGAEMEDEVSELEAQISSLRAERDALRGERDDLKEDRDYFERKAEEGMDKLRTAAARAAKKTQVGAAQKSLEHWQRVAQVAKRHAHRIAVLERARRMHMERIVRRTIAPAFSRWRESVRVVAAEKDEEDTDEMDRLLHEARDDARRWREAAERGWAAVQRMGHKALRKMLRAISWRAFGHWKKLAAASSITRQYRRETERVIESLRARIVPLESEVGALRLFKDAMASSERAMIVRKGGGYVSMDAFVKSVEDRIGAAALEDALAGSKEGEAIATHYGLSGVCKALKLQQARATGGEPTRGGRANARRESTSPRGKSKTTWRRVLPPPRDVGVDARAALSPADRYQPRGGDVRAPGFRAYGPGYDDAVRPSADSAYEPPPDAPEINLRVTHKSGFDHQPGRRVNLKGDDGGLAKFTAGVGASAVTRAKVLSGKIGGLDARRRTERLSIRDFRVSYDAPSAAAPSRAVADPVAERRLGTSGSHPIGFSDVGSLRGVDARPRSDLPRVGVGSARSRALEEDAVRESP